MAERVYAALLKGSALSSADLQALKGLDQRSTAWFELRKMSFGASVIGGLLNQSDWLNATAAFHNFLYGFRPEPWLRPALSHGCTHEPLATDLFLTEFQRKYCCDGEHFEMEVMGMMKAEGYEMLHFSADGIPTPFSHCLSRLS